MVRTSIFLATFAALIASPADAEIGRIKSVIGLATVEREATHIPAASGQELMPGDWLETGKDGRITIAFIDDTRFAVGPDSRIALSKFEYDPTSQKGSFVAKVERGSIAVVSGRISKSRCGAGPQDPTQTKCGGMEVQTPESDLAIHGTRFIVVVRK